eukprot:354601-Chlamydomonas_euryale.AAC.3
MLWIRRLPGRGFAPAPSLEPAAALLASAGAEPRTSRRCQADWATRSFQLGTLARLLGRKVEKDSDGVGPSCGHNGWRQGQPRAFGGEACRCMCMPCAVQCARSATLSERDACAMR